MMYDAKKKLPEPEVDVLAVVKFESGAEVCEGFRTMDNFWYLYKYGRNGWGDWNVTSWTPMPQESDFATRFLSFGLGYVSGIALFMAMMLLVG